MFITPEARREIEALTAFRPAPSTWGILIGHKRGFRFIVEKVFPATSGRALPDERLVAELDHIWPGRVIGLFAVRPGAAFCGAVLGPFLYGRLILSLELSGRKFSMRPSVVEFERKFYLAPVAFAPAGKAETHE